MNIEKFMTLLFRESKGELTPTEKCQLWFQLIFSTESRTQRKNMQRLDELITADLDKTLNEEDSRYLEQLKSDFPVIHKMWTYRKEESERNFPTMAYVGNGNRKMVYVTFLEIKRLAKEAGITLK